MPKTIARREALRLLVVSTAAALPVTLLGCKRELSCEDVSGIAPPDLTMRTTTAAYVDKSPDPAKTCSGCVQFQPAGEKTCGGCKVVKGPINPNGYCKLWVKKPA